MTGDLLELLKQEGQARSVERTYPTGQDAFFAILRTFPVGQLLSVNDLRLRLDGAEIPDSARGGLFAGAVKAGLLEPSMLPDGLGGAVPHRIPSTGTSAHKATVRVYRRTDPAARKD